MRLLSRTFRSLKIPNPNPLKASASSSSSSATSKRSQSQAKPIQISDSKSKSRSWSVYLIISTNTPIKTYVGVTTNFSRRLKQHNGELKGGAKATRAGRPWVPACTIQGFHDQNEACEFELKWKNLSRKLHCKRDSKDKVKQINDGSIPLLQHRQIALNRVKASLDCSHLKIKWKLSPL